jgi:dipeptidyl aminopeptidase/acylaminoacyl peptidase
MNRILSSAVFLVVFAGTPLAQTKPTLTEKDYGKWESLGFGATFSSRGEWLAYNINRQNEENELKLRNNSSGETVSIQYGTGAAFSKDGKWLVYTLGISPAEKEKLQKEKKPIKNSVAWRNLQTGQTITVAEVTAWSLSPDGRFLVMKRYPPEGKRSADLLVQDLSNNTRLTFGNVAEYAWSGSAPLLAFAIDAQGGTGNGVQLYNGSTGVVQVLESSSDLYRALTWRSKSDDLAVLRSQVDTAYRDTANVVVAWKGVGGTAAMKKLVVSTAGFPSGMRVAEYRNPSWSKDGGVLFVGIRPREPKSAAIKKSDQKVSDVEIWHPNDVRLIPSQRSSESRDLRATMLLAWRLGDDKVMQVGTDVLENANALEGARYAVEIDRKPYPWGQKFGRNDQDVWVVDLSTGARSKVLEKVRHYYGGSPSGTKITWSDGKDFWMVDLTTGKKTNLTAKLTSTKKADFVDYADDHPNNVKPIIRPAGWTKDESAYLVYDAYDIWSIAPDGSGGRKMTNGAKEGVVHRLAFGGFFSPDAEAGYDLSKPVYLTLFGKLTKKSGFARLSPAGGVERLVFQDNRFGSLVKADSAEVYLYSRESYEESPNYYLGGPNLSDATRITDTNPFQKDYAWGRAELFNYKSTIGRPLQAVLHYPANYDPSKKYPLIVYTYELLTQNFHTYVVPRETDAYNVTSFVQNGYFVLQPDIVFRPREPGIAVLHSVEPAVMAVIKRGLVDPKRVGHCGHSQGGYEAAYLGTHSKLFATTVSGAGITDMISFAGQLHWGPGNAEFDHWETGQFRMEVAPWEDYKAMLDNSPLHMVHKMPAKSMLLEVGGDDGVVDPRQGTLFWNYARRAGKHVVMILYPGEGHGLGKKENGIDYHRRVLQWFAHYLKGEPAEPWITNGQTWLERKAILDANK